MPKLRLVNNRGCILFFVKYPLAGQVKTRLASAVGEGHTDQLYRYFVTDMLDMLADVDAEIIVCFDPFEGIKKYRQWIGGEFKYVAQAGSDIGCRMSNSLRWAFGAGYCRAIVIGSDIPDLPSSIVDGAIMELATNNAVVGPSSDGGYYLIGFNGGSFAGEVFDGISWSSGVEFDETMRVFNEMDDYSVKVLDTWHDIDDAGDLKDLVARNKRTAFRKSKSYEYAFEIVNSNAKKISN
jgi:rSAM/selenodomain-associated transferase 1